MMLVRSGVRIRLLEMARQGGADSGRGRGTGDGMTATVLALVDGGGKLVFSSADWERVRL